jgi:hypothetical protein
MTVFELRLFKSIIPVENGDGILAVSSKRECLLATAAALILHIVDISSIFELVEWRLSYTMNNV